MQASAIRCWTARRSSFIDRAPEQYRVPLRRHWQDAWRAAVPDSQPAAVWDLLAPIAAARQAMIYRLFLDNIESAEHPYHRDDPRQWLERVARIVRAERSGIGSNL